MKLTITSKAMEQLEQELKPGAGLLLFYDTSGYG